MFKGGREEHRTRSAHGAAVNVALGMVHCRALCWNSGVHGVAVACVKHHQQHMRSIDVINPWGQGKEPLVVSSPAV